jgi:acyl carrier protein
VPDEGTLLFGVDAPLDSIALVGLVVAVEERLELLTGKSIRLVDERAMSMKKSPFRSVGSFADYIDSVLAEAL